MISSVTPPRGISRVTGPRLLRVATTVAWRLVRLPSSIGDLTPPTALGYDLNDGWDIWHVGFRHDGVQGRSRWMLNGKHYGSNTGS